jgi:hypothetical protein
VKLREKERVSINMRDIKSQERGLRSFTPNSNSIMKLLGMTYTKGKSEEQQQQQQKRSIE